MLDGAPDDGQRGAQLVARVGGELALAAEGRRWLSSDSRIGTSARLRVDRAERRRRRGRRRHRRRSTRQERVEGLLLGRAILDAPGCRSSRSAIDPLGHRPDRQSGRSSAGRTSRPALTAAATRALLGQAGRDDLAPRATLSAVRVDDHRERAARAAAEDEARLRPRPAARVLDVLGDLARRSSAARRRSPASVVAGDPVQREAEDEEHDQGRQAAPQDEPPADTSGSAGCRQRWTRRRPGRRPDAATPSGTVQRYPTPRTVSIRSPSGPSFVRR